MLHHLEDDGLGPAPPIRAHDPGADPVTMHGLEHLFGRNKDIIAACIGPHESEAIAMANQPAIKAGL
jgi:hypothetical protein